MEEISKMKIADLKKKCKDSGLPITGNKIDLVTRLQQHLNNGVGDETVLNEAELLGELDASESQKSPVSNVDEDLLLGDSVSDSKDDKEIPVEVNVPETIIPEVNKTDTEIEEPAPKIQKLDDVKEVSTDEIKLKSSELTADERLKLRAARFESENGSVASAEDKKLERAKRFGLDVKSVESGSIDIEKLKKREERFGVAVSDTLKKEAEEGKKQKRMERFGSSKDDVLNVISGDLSPNVATAEAAKKIIRVARFGVVSVGDEDKKKARAARFGVAS